LQELEQEVEAVVLAFEATLVELDVAAGRAQLPRGVQDQSGEEKL
jgi:hypothetical protein